MSAALRLDLDERRARLLDLRMAAAEGKDFAAYLDKLKPKS